MADEPVQQQKHQILAGVVKTLLDDLKTGNGDKDRRRQVALAHSLRPDPANFPIRRQMRRSGRFDYRVTLPDHIDAEKVEAWAEAMDVVAGFVRRN